MSTGERCDDFYFYFVMFLDGPRILPLSPLCSLKRWSAAASAPSFLLSSSALAWQPEVKCGKPLLSSVQQVAPPVKACRESAGSQRWADQREVLCFLFSTNIIFDIFWTFLLQQMFVLKPNVLQNYFLNLFFSFSPQFSPGGVVCSSHSLIQEPFAGSTPPSKQGGLGH